MEQRRKIIYEPDVIQIAKSDVINQPIGKINIAINGLTIVKPKRGADGYYHFICENCFKPFKSKSPKAITCGQSCRNEKNRNLRIVLYAPEDEFNRKFSHNAKVLRNLSSEGIIYPVLQVLDEVMKFNFDVLPEIEKYNGEDVRFFGEYGIVMGKQFKIVKR